ncbi:hypothetical protein GJI88_13110 [Lactococcus lactis subsp. lactis]|nr:hypothetical protein [Lactococcus lactis subsp. lactis]
MKRLMSSRVVRRVTRESNPTLSSKVKLENAEIELLSLKSGSKLDFSKLALMKLRKTVIIKVKIENKINLKLRLNVLMK